METNARLEELSDKVRRGEPIGFLEALAVIDYQENLRQAREANSFIGRVKALFKPTAHQATKEPR